MIQRAVVAVRRIDARDTHPLRHAILRPMQPIAEMQYPGDELPTTWHYGAFDNKSLIGIASIYSEPMPESTGDHHYRLRGMAVDSSHADKGVGRQLVLACLGDLKEVGCDLLWCNARSSAHGFYEKLGFDTHGDEFEIGQIGPHYIMSRAV